MKTSLSSPLWLLGLAAGVVPLFGCNDAPATLVVVNSYPAQSDAAIAAPITIYKVWWKATLIVDPVPPDGASAVARTVPGSDHAYALLAPGWLPESGAPPTVLVAAQSAERLSLGRGAQLEILISDDTFIGNCAAGRPLDAESASLIVERIFPGDFAGASYDPTTCATTPIAGDAATPDDDAGSDVAADSGAGQ